VGAASPPSAGAVVGAAGAVVGAASPPSAGAVVGAASPPSAGAVASAAPSAAVGSVSVVVPVSPPQAARTSASANTLLTIQNRILFMVICCPFCQVSSMSIEPNLIPYFTMFIISQSL
jgi:hypothetical protein